MFCSNCGKEISDKAVMCVGCGVMVEGKTFQQPTIIKNKIAYASEKDWITILLLSIFLGGFGVHRYYAGKIGTGILMFMLSCFFVGFVWVIIDIIIIASGKFKDSYGRPIVRQ
jgi:TM2 domain-containing membrane protein YozV